MYEYLFCLFGMCVFFIWRLFILLFWFVCLKDYKSCRICQTQRCVFDIKFNNKSYDVYIYSKQLIKSSVKIVHKDNNHAYILCLEQLFVHMWSEHFITHWQFACITTIHLMILFTSNWVEKILLKQ